MAIGLSRFDNRPTGFLTAAQACERLGVKPATLYTYVSRGLVRSIRGPDRRQRLYLADDVQRVLSKAEARRGHRAVAIGALRFGDPVLDSALTRVGEDGFAYRGWDVVERAEAETPFEQIAEWLWGVEPSRTPWPTLPRRLVRPGSPDIPLPWQMSAFLCRLATDDPRPEERARNIDDARARRIIRGFSDIVAPPPDRRARPIASSIVAGLDLPQDALPAINSALVLVADHELNVSTFTARVAASGGANLYAAVGAALHAFSGPKHGGACERIEALVAEVGSARRAKSVVRDRLRRGRGVPGFGHPLYPEGDPRAAPLIRWARSLAPRSQPQLRTLLAIIGAMEEQGPQRPTLDAGLVALTAALGLPPGTATALFAVGRTAGWVAHIFEQRMSGTLLRPRARYVGPA